MPNRKWLRGQVAFLLAVILMLLWNSPLAIPVAILFMVIGIIFVMTAESSQNDWMKQ